MAAVTASVMMAPLCHTMSAEPPAPPLLAWPRGKWAPRIGASGCPPPPLESRSSAPLPVEVCAPPQAARTIAKSKAARVNGVSNAGEQLAGVGDKLRGLDGDFI